MQITFDGREPRIRLSSSDRIQVAGSYKEPTQLQIGEGDNWGFLDATKEQLLDLADRIYEHAGINLDGLFTLRWTNRKSLVPTDVCSPIGREPAILIVGEKEANALAHVQTETYGDFDEEHDQAVSIGLKEALRQGLFDL